MQGTAGNTRSRTFTWEDPAIGATAVREMSGLEYLAGVGGGQLPLPPLLSTLGIRPVEVESGRAVFEVEPAEYHYNPMGIVHGGVAAALCDTAVGCAIHSALPTGSGYSTLDLNLHFVRPMTRETGPVRCEGRTLHVGGRIATAEARVTDGAGKLYAHATTTCMLLRSGAEERR
jgi:uncharacterized protein (TIGR00369 family)